MRNSFSTRLAPTRKATIAGVIAFTVAAPMATGAVGGTAKDRRDAAASAALAPAQASPCRRLRCRPR